MTKKYFSVLSMLIIAVLVATISAVYAQTSPANFTGEPDKTKKIVAIWTLAGEGEVFGKEVVNRSRKILPKFTIPSVEKVS